MHHFPLNKRYPQICHIHPYTVSFVYKHVASDDGTFPNLLMFPSWTLGFWNCLFVVPFISVVVKSLKLLSWSYIASLLRSAVHLRRLWLILSFKRTNEAGCQVSGYVMLHLEIFCSVLQHFSFQHVCRYVQALKVKGQRQCSGAVNQSIRTDTVQSRGRDHPGPIEPPARIFEDSQFVSYVFLDISQPMKDIVQYVQPMNNSRAR